MCVEAEEVVLLKCLNFDCHRPRKCLRFGGRPSCLCLQKEEEREEQSVDFARMAGCVEVSCSSPRLESGHQTCWGGGGDVKLKRRHLIDLNMCLNVSNWTCHRGQLKVFNKGIPADLWFHLWSPWLYLSHFRNSERFQSSFLQQWWFEGRTVHHAQSRYVVVPMCPSAAVGSVLCISCNLKGHCDQLLLIS